MDLFIFEVKPDNDDEYDDQEVKQTQELLSECEGNHLQEEEQEPDTQVIVIEPNDRFNDTQEEETDKQSEEIIVNQEEDEGERKNDKTLENNDNQVLISSGSEEEEEINSDCNYSDDTLNESDKDDDDDDDSDKSGHVEVTDSVIMVRDKKNLWRNSYDKLSLNFMKTVQNQPLPVQQKKLRCKWKDFDLGKQKSHNGSVELNNSIQSPPDNSDSCVNPEPYPSKIKNVQIIFNHKKSTDFTPFPQRNINKTTKLKVKNGKLKETVSQFTCPLTRSEEIYSVEDNDVMCLSVTENQSEALKSEGSSPQVTEKKAANSEGTVSDQIYPLVREKQDSASEDIDSELKFHRVRETEDTKSINTVSDSSSIVSENALSNSAPESDRELSNSCCPLVSEKKLSHSSRVYEDKLRKSVANRKLSCSLCGSCFTDFQTKLKHEQRNIDAYKCVICNKSFSSICVYGMHIRTHTESPTENCTVTKGLAEEGTIDKYVDKSGKGPSEVMDRAIINELNVINVSEEEDDKTEVDRIVIESSDSECDNPLEKTLYCKSSGKRKITSKNNVKSLKKHKNAGNFKEGYRKKTTKGLNTDTTLKNDHVHSSKSFKKGNYIDKTRVFQDCLYKEDDMSDDKGFYQCDICELYFEDLDSKKAHTVITNQAFECSVCRKRFNTKCVYGAHLRMHKRKSHSVFVMQEAKTEN